LKACEGLQRRWHCETQSPQNKKCDCPYVTSAYMESFFAIFLLVCSLSLL